MTVMVSEDSEQNALLSGAAQSTPNTTQHE